MDFPRWAFWLANAIVVLLLYGVSQVAQLASAELLGGALFGYFVFFVMFRWHYGWWPDFNMDGEDDANSQLPRIDPDRTNYR